MWIKKRLICDCCGRQIVSYKANDKYIIGPASDGVLILGINKHACPECSPIEQQEEQAFIENEIIKIEKEKIYVKH